MIFNIHSSEVDLIWNQEKRTKILEDVMETETYKVAKDLLDKYGPLEQTSKPAKVSKVHVVTFAALLSMTLLLCIC